MSVSSWFVSHVICRPFSHLFYDKHRLNKDILLRVFHNTELPFVLHLSWSNMQPSSVGQSLRKIFKKETLFRKEMLAYIVTIMSHFQQCKLRSFLSKIRITLIIQYLSTEMLTNSLRILEYYIPLLTSSLSLKSSLSRYRPIYQLSLPQNKQVLCFTFTVYIC